MKKLTWLFSALFMVCVTPILILHCAGQTPAQSAATVSNLRQTVCGYVELTAPSTPELDKIQRLCKAGAALKPIAAAYAGCVSSDAPAAPAKTAEPPDAAVVTMDAMVREPWPDAGQ